MAPVSVSGVVTGFAVMMLGRRKQAKVKLSRMKGLLGLGSLCWSMMVHIFSRVAQLF